METKHPSSTRSYIKISFYIFTHQLVPILSLSAINTILLTFFMAIYKQHTNVDTFSPKHSGMIKYFTKYAVYANQCTPSYKHPFPRTLPQAQP